MVKKKNTLPIVLMVFGAALLLFSLSGGLGFLAIGVERENILESDYVLKVGLLESDEPDGLDEIIDNFYGYIILETPIQLTATFQDDLIEAMNQVNIQVDGIPEGEPDTIFTDGIISIIEENSLQIGNLPNLIDEGHNSLDNLCDYIKFSEEVFVSSEVKSFIDFCDKKSNDVLVRRGSAWELNLPDIDEYKVDQDITCTFVDGSDNKVCSIGDRTLIKTGNKIRLSQAEGKIYESASNIIIAFGERGIKEADAIPPRFQFEQLGFFVESEFDNMIREDGSWYRVLTNSQGVADASEGKIDQTTKIKDLYEGLKNKKIFRSPSTFKNLGLTAVGLVALVVGSFMFRRKKD